MFIYPHLTKQNDDRCKLDEEDIKEVKYCRYKLKMLVKDIAELFKISKTLVVYWTNENTRKRVKEMAKRYKPKDKQKHKAIDRQGKKKRRRLYNLKKYGTPYKYREYE